MQTHIQVRLNTSQSKLLLWNICLIQINFPENLQIPDLKSSHYMEWP
jgi:hypothetical protein